MKRRRNSLRHPNRDYAHLGAYFITICAHKGISLFGQVVNSVMHLNPLGKIAHQAWLDLARTHDHIAVDPFVVMPNHVHAVIWIHEVTEGVGAERRYGKPTAGSISALVNAYKATVTKRAIRVGLVPGPPVWQRNFYDHIIRDERALANIQAYILTNPARWATDQLHPDAPPNPFNQDPNQP